MILFFRYEIDGDLGRLRDFFKVVLLGSNRNGIRIWTGLCFKIFVFYFCVVLFFLYKIKF